MGITYRQGNDGRLSVQQMDDNFHYLEDQLAGLTQSNSGSGTSGTSGTSGQNGATGPAGQNGATGPAGQNGATGPQGPTGPAGQNGATGPQGPTGPAGEFNVTGGISFPFLPGNQRTGSGDNLQFEKGSVYQKIISTQDGTGSAPTVERLVISGGDSYKNGLTYSGEGGDIYLWAGKGQDGGDIKVDAGEGISSGGTVKIRGGYTETGVGGFVQILAGESNNGYGGDVQLTAGDGYGSGMTGIGGDVLITSGYGSNTAGNITLNARDGGTTAGNVIVKTDDVERMRITNDGNIGIGTASPSVALDVVGDVNITGAINSNGSQIESVNLGLGPTIVLKPDSSLETDQYIILDPTEGGPNHIHIRAGGPIDDSAADLFIGGEDNNLRVSDTDKTVQINSKNLYTQDSASFPSGANYDSATWSGNLITITNPIIGLVNFINGYQAATDIFTVFYDPTTAVSLNITNKVLSNPTVLTVDQTAPTASLAITQMLIEIVRYQSGRVIADNGTVTIQTGDTDGPEYWTFGSPDGVGTLTFPDNSEQTTAYPGLINFISSGITAPGSSVEANETNVSINFSDGGGTWSFGATAVSFPDNTVQTTAYAPKYKVYTALLTQSGTSSTQNISTGDLTVGVTYFINNNIGGNFTNVGAPNNDNGTYFVATGTTPADWGINLGGDTLTFNTGAPTVIVLENTIGHIWFAYNSDGDYRIYSNELFTLNKSWGVIAPSDLINNLLYQQIFFSDISEYNITTFSEGAPANSVLYNTPIEIRVYN